MDHELEFKEWLLRSEEWRKGYEDGMNGKLMQSQGEQYRQGWMKAYKKYVCKERPDLCRNLP